MKTTAISAIIGLTTIVALSPITAMGQTDRYQALANTSFKNDYPTVEASRTLDEELFFQRAVQTYLWALPAVNMHAMKEGQAKTFGEGYNVLAIFENRLKSRTLINTPNSDVIYGIGFLDLGKDGPMVINAPPMLQALIDDFWHRPIEGPEIDGIQYAADIGLPGPDKGKGGKYLILPPGYEGSVDEDNYFVYRSRTHGVFVFLRGFFNDPSHVQPAVDNMERIKIYPLKGEAKPMDFKHATEVDADYLFPSDASYFAMLDRFIQSDVVDDVDPYMHGMLAAIGIQKGKSFEPTQREEGLLNAAAQTAWKMAKNISANFDREENGIWYEGHQWVAHTKTDLDNFFDTHLDLDFNRRKTGHTDVNAKAHMFINHYSVSPGMISSRVGIGAKYTSAYKDANGDYLIGDHTYKLNLPANVPAKLFWSVTVYDAKTAAGLSNGQDYPSIGSRDEPEQNENGSTDLYFGPEAPKGKEKNWVKTVPEKGWFAIIRLYGPEQGFFDRTWVPGDFEKIKQGLLQKAAAPRLDDIPRESFKGYQAFPDDSAAMQARIDERDLHGATQAYLWSMSIATVLAWEEANLKVADHLDLVTYITPYEKRDVITANATTPYAVAYADLSKTDGMVEIFVPAGPVGGLVNDGQMRSVVDLGLAGPDQGKGGKYLILGPGIEEPANHDADYVVHSKSNLLLTGFRVLAGDAEQRQAMFSAYKLNAVGKPSTTKVVSIGDTPYRGSNLRGMAHWRELHAFMQREEFGPEDAMALQFLKRLGIEQGKGFNPDERQTRILLEAEEKGFAMSVALSAARERDEGLRHLTFYEGGTWSNPLGVTAIYSTVDNNGVMELDLRTSWSHEAITMSEGMTAETPGVGSKYLAAYRDADGNFFNSAYSYELSVPANPPAEQFWSLTAYNAKSRSMVYTDRKDVSSRHDIHVNEDGTTPVYVSSECQNMPYRQNCINVKGQGDFFFYFRVYAPTQDYFDKKWMLPDISRIK